MKYGINKINIISGHTLGANEIPREYETTEAEKTYSEGTAMFELVEFLDNINGVDDVRNGNTTDISRRTRGYMMGKAGGDVCIALHTDWSTRNGIPNHGIMTAIVPLYNRIHNVAEQTAMATKLFKPLADKLGLQFKIKTKKGGGAWDYYTYLSACNRNNVPYPVLLEIGYHQDFANNMELYRNETYKLFADLCDDTRGVPVMNYVNYKVNNTTTDRVTLAYFKDALCKEWAGSVPNGYIVEMKSENKLSMYGQVIRDNRGNPIENGIEGYFDKSYMPPFEAKFIYDTLPELPVIPPTTELNTAEKLIQAIGALISEFENNK